MLCNGWRFDTSLFDLQLIGGTPLVELTKIAAAKGAVARILGKLLEWYQPGGSLKDRIAHAWATLKTITCPIDDSWSLLALWWMRGMCIVRIILDAERKRLITPGKSTLIELTCGNIGIALALVAKQEVYDVIFVMPNYYSLEHRILFRSLGAEVIITGTLTFFEHPAQYQTWVNWDSLRFLVSNLNHFCNKLLIYDTFSSTTQFLL